MPNYKSAGELYAIFGGTFDPPHYGHLRALQQCADICEINKIALLPAFIPALKTDVSAAKHRVAMTTLLCELDDRFDIDLSEVDANEASFTANTLAQMAHDKPHQKRIFIIGLDSLLNIDKWYKWQTIFDYAHVLVMARPLQANISEVAQLNLDSARVPEHHGSNNEELALNLYNFYTNQAQFDKIVGTKMDVPTRQWLLSKLARAESGLRCINLHRFKDIINTSATGNLWFVNNQTIALSSSAIRTHLMTTTSKKDNSLLEKLLPSSILHYINKHKLYKAS